MSENHSDQSIRDSRLSDELAALESMLGAVSLPPSGVQRDALMFQAGGEAAGRAAYQQVVAGRRTTLVCSASSAAIAASLAVAIMMWLQSAVAPVGSVVESSGQAQVEIATVAAGQPISERRANRIRNQVATRAVNNRTAPLLVIRNRALVQQWSDPWTETEASLVGSTARAGIPARAKNSREMLQEFLPRGRSPNALDRISNPRSLDWPWITKRRGETT